MSDRETRIARIPVLSSLELSTGARCAGLLAGVALLALLVLSYDGAARPAAAASFDCQKATQPLDKKICGDGDLSKLDEDLAAAYAKAKTAISPEGQKLLQASQRDWLAFARHVCKSRLDPKIAKAAEDTPVQCLTTEYHERIEDLEAAAVKTSGFTFGRVDLYALGEDPSMDPSGRPGFSYRRISFPRIDQAPAGVNVTAWNKLVAVTAQKLAASDDDDKGRAAETAALAAPDNIAKPGMGSAPPADVDVGFNITLVTPEMIAVELSYSVMGHGAAHPGGFSEMHNIMLADGHELTAKDLFRDGSDWQGYLVKRCHAEWLKVMEDAPDQVDDKAIADVVDDPHLWQLTDKGISIDFPFYSVGPYVVGEQLVDFTWDELKPYLVYKLPFTRPASPG